MSGLSEYLLSEDKAADDAKKREERDRDKEERKKEQEERKKEQESRREERDKKREDAEKERVEKKKERETEEKEEEKEEEDADVEGRVQRLEKEAGIDKEGNKVEKPKNNKKKGVSEMELLEKIDIFLGEEDEKKDSKYQEFVKKKLGDRNLGDMDDKETKAFFDEVDKEWKAKDEK